MDNEAKSRMPYPEKFELVPGALYRIRLTNGAWVTAEFRFSRSCDGYGSRKLTTRYHFNNVTTNREITIKSRRKIRQCQVKS